jgi:O-antigen/teichoic acid export membrane protein
MGSRTDPARGELSDAAVPERLSPWAKGLDAFSRLIGSPGEVSHTSSYLMLSTVGSSVLGVAFWAVAAHLFSARAVGAASAEVSTMGLLAGFAQLNFANAYVRYLPVAELESGRAIRRGYAVALVTAIVAAVIFFFTPLWRTVVGSDWVADAVFFCAVPLWTVFILQDGVLTGLSRAAVVPIENIGFGAAKLALLPLTGLIASGNAVFLAWTLPVVPAVGLVSAFLVRNGTRRDAQARARRAGASALPAGRELWSFLSAECVHSLVTSAATFLLPVIIEVRAGAVTEAHFYVPWLIYLGFNYLFSNVSSGLVVAMSREGRASRPPKQALVLMASIATLGLVFTVLIPGPLLSVLSAAYAVGGAGVLRLVGLSLPFGALSALFISYLWIEQRIWSLVAARIAQSAVLIGVTALFLGDLGLRAAGFGIIGESAVLAVAGAPMLWRRRHALSGASVQIDQK